MYMKTKNMPSVTFIQKYFTIDMLVVAPNPKAHKSVTDVIVMATPACFIATPNLLESF